MGGLALIVSFILLVSIVSGPLGYILSKFSWMPKIFLWIIGIINIGIGLWWLLLPIGFIKYIGLSNIYFGFLLLKK